MLSNLEEARAYLGDKTLYELRSDEDTRDFMHVRMQDASVALCRRCGKQGARDFVKEMEARYPSVPWRRFQSLAGISRLDFNSVTAEFLWKVFEPGGIAALVERAVKEELTRSQIPSTAQNTSQSPSLRK